MATIAFSKLDGGRGIRLTAAGDVPGQALVDANVMFLKRFSRLLDSTEYWFSDYSQMKIGITAEHAREIATLAVDARKARIALVTRCPW